MFAVYILKKSGYNSEELTGFEPYFLILSQKVYHCMVLLNVTFSANERTRTSKGFLPLVPNLNLEDFPSQFPKRSIMTGDYKGVSDKTSA